MTAARIVLVLACLLPVSGCDAADSGTTFDFSHVDAAFEYLDNPGEGTLAHMAATAAAAHLKRHSDVTGYYAPDASALDISRDLLTNDVYAAKARLTRIKDLVRATKQNGELQSRCMAEAKATLPADFAFSHPLYVTWGYDIGVSMAGSSSLNIAHPHFDKDPREILFYCIHEMHHAGVMTYHAWPMPVAEIDTRNDMAAFVRYATFLEGTAVYAAYAARTEAGALAADDDYLKLEDATATAAALANYWSVLEGLETGTNLPLSEADWEAVGRLSDGERLWYIAGAAMARKIDRDLGRTAYRRVVKQGPDAFFATYQSLQ